MSFIPGNQRGMRGNVLRPPLLLTGRVVGQAANGILECVDLLARQLRVLILRRLLGRLWWGRRSRSGGRFWFRARIVTGRRITGPTRWRGGASVVAVILAWRCVRGRACIGLLGAVMRTHVLMHVGWWPVCTRRRVLAGIAGIAGVRVAAILMMRRAVIRRQIGAGAQAGAQYGDRGGEGRAKHSGGFQLSTPCERRRNVTERPHPDKQKFMRKR